ncbi:hypothetical protein CSAL01_06847 [Colletotrichum salicis]|uniref:DUF6546 domain-containing protein n=1 Tax=Colletotrichum salicis TaxID=1209931 RepID=A0A135V4S5_9PEZI|nr:hypothetical protein CSAL01_06847 [Colletotrichum salicis]
MSSTSHGKKQWDSRWDSLPREIRLLITQYLIQDGCPLAPFATVSREMQTDIERHNFARIRLTPSRLANFRAMIQRIRGLVGYIWFCLELDEYDCTACPPPSGPSTSYEFTEGLEISGTDKCPITASFQDLFSVLGEWKPHGDLTLDISLYSPSDSEHWFPYLTFLPDNPPNMPADHAVENASRKYHDPEHGWSNGLRHLASPPWALRKLFHLITEQGPHDSDQEELDWWDQLPSVPAVTSLLLRQQNCRRWKPVSLAHMFARFPRLQELHYEPWREWDDWGRALQIEILTPDKVDSTGIGALLLVTAAAAEKMPRLETMDIWNGRKGLAALFRYQVFRNEGEAVFTWRGTLELAMELAVIQAWQAVTKQYDVLRLNVAVERLDGTIIRSHGVAIQHLGLSGQVIRPVSLQQIQMEQEALEGVATVES